MATFEAKIYRLEIEPHPNADAIELAKVGEYRSVVQKGQYKTGDLGVYIPEAAVLPDWIIEYLGLEGRLAGSRKNRVKAIKLRGVLSQGLIYPVSTLAESASSHIMRTRNGTKFVELGDVVTDVLEITKYEPPIPVHMAGEVFNAFGLTLKFDVENFKRFPDVLQEDEEVVFTEKLHGTWTCLAHHPDVDHPLVTSKGLSEKGLAFKFNEANKGNLYINTLERTVGPDDNGHVIDRLRKLLSVGSLADLDTPVYILGETFGQGVQDLHYGASVPQFRVFDIYVGHPGKGWYLDYEELVIWCKKLNLETVPVLYRGPFSVQQMDIYTNGNETVSGKDANIREGIVMKPIHERRDEMLGRVMLKSVSEKYLLRKNKNATEFN